MVSIGVTLIIWGLALLCIGTIYLIGARKYFSVSKKYKIEMEEAAKRADIRLRRGYNKIATLTPNELHSYLGTMFTRFLELGVDADISDHDPDAKVVLMAVAEAGLMDYLGPETLDAIDYYYGKNYVHRWVVHSYRVLEKRGAITSLMKNKSAKSDYIQKELV